MAERMLRRGLPRVAGGDPWPPALTVEVAETSVPGAAETMAAETIVPEPVASEAAPVAAEHVVAPAASAVMRRGLPRIEGGEPWPAASAAPVVATSPAVAAATSVAETPAKVAAAPAVGTAATTAATTAPGAALRRGLPRVDGGEPWPPAGMTAHASTPSLEDAPAADAASQMAPVQASTTVAIAAHDVSTPLPFRRSVWQGKAPRHATEPEPEVSRLRPTWTQAIGGLMGAAALGLVAAAGVALVRALLSMPFMQDFLAMYPGEYHLPEGAQVGFPAWVGWQHFFNVFLMVLIIRSGLRVRSEKRPTVFWTARGNAKTKISLTLWFHQALDILWLTNGVIFVVLLFVSGHWMRIVPTSWEVFPNAFSALLQYISFDWPTDNGWVNYNSLQQLAYFTTVFIAAPLAVITGVRMSGLWPKKAERLSKLYPVEWARALHFPIMLYFVAFIVVHVALVMLTGMLRNLNHMYAAQGSVDPSAYAGNWLGFWIFVASLVVIVGAWFAARPLVLAPIAKVFGNVSGR